MRPGLESPQAVIKVIGQRAAKATEDLAAKIIGEVGQKLHAVPKITPKNIPVWVHSKIKRHEVKQDEGQRSSHEDDAIPSTSDSRRWTRTVDEESEASGVISSDSSVFDQSPNDDVCTNFSETVSSVGQSETCFSQERTTFKSDFNLKEKIDTSKGIDVVDEIPKTTSLSDLELLDNYSLETKDFTSAKNTSSNIITSNEIVFSRIKPLKRRSSARRSKTNRKISFRIPVCVN